MLRLASPGFFFSQTSPQVSLESVEGNSPSGLGITECPWSASPDCITFQLLQQEPGISSFCSKDQKNSLLQCLFFMQEQFHPASTLCLPLVPQIHPQVTGNLTGRSNLTKISKPPSQCILTLFFSPVLVLLPSCSTAETCQRDQRLSSIWLWRLPLQLRMEECKVFSTSDTM